jgi:hypothetical protein
MGLDSDGCATALPGLITTDHIAGEQIPDLDEPTADSKFTIRRRYAGRDGISRVDRRAAQVREDESGTRHDACLSGSRVRPNSHAWMNSTDTSDRCRSHDVADLIDSKAKGFRRGTIPIPVREQS